GAGWTLVQLFRQENTKLYSLQPGRTKGRLLMDSNLDTGDVVYRYDPEFDEEECRLWRVQWDSVYISDRWAFKNLKTVYRGYVLCKPIVYDDINFSGTEKSSITSYWVEGIGDLETVWYHQLYNLLYPTDGSKRHITECWADGELIYYNVPNVLEPNYDSIEDMLSGIAAPAVRQPANDGSLHDLQGRRIGNAPKQGIYLQGGRKMMVE
ncbi:MAG: hypothetical protein IJ729_01750, partial [Alloprevotella sp.]|nr:hypothetical protein [Alloprevotella sp.]